MSIDEINPRQLAPSVGNGDANFAVVMVPSGEIYNSSATESHLLFSAFDITTHSPTTLRDFESVVETINRGHPRSNSSHHLTPLSSLIVPPRSRSKASSTSLEFHRSLPLLEKKGGQRLEPP